MISFVRKWYWNVPGIDSTMRRSTNLVLTQSFRCATPSHAVVSHLTLKYPCSANQQSCQKKKPLKCKCQFTLQLKPRGRFRPKLCKFSKSTKLSIKSAFENVNFQFQTREEYFNSQSHYLHQMLRSINLLCVWCLNKQINSFWEILFAQSLCWVHSTQLPSSASMKTICEHMCVGYSPTVTI